MTTTALDGAFAALTAAVQAERRAATDVVDHLARVRLLLEEGAYERLAGALGELELAAAGLDAAGRRREQVRRDLCGALGIGEGPCTLARLVARAPAPWAEALAEDRSALRELAERIEREAAEDRRRAEHDLAVLRRAIGRSSPVGAGLGSAASPGERRLVADLELAPLLTELRIREITFEAIIAVTSELTTREPAPSTGRHARST